jgi:hypothetical protein
MEAKNQIALQRSLNIPLDDPRVRRIQELGAKRNENTKEEEEELLRLILLLKKELPSK